MRRCSMWSSMSRSTSLSSSIFGLAKTAKPTLRSASTHGRTTSALPGAMLVKTVASGSTDDAGLRRADLRGAGQQPAAQRVEARAFQGRRPAAQDRAQPHVEVGGVPHQQHAPAVERASEAAGRCPVAEPDRQLRRPLSRCSCGRFFCEAHTHRLFQISSVTALPASWAFVSYLVVGRTTEIGSGFVPGSTRTQPGFGVADFGDLLGIPGVVRRGVQDTTGE